MNSVMNKTRLAEQRYRDKLKKDLKKINLSNKKHQKHNKKLEKVKKVMKNIIIKNCRKQKRKQNYKRKSNTN